MTKIKLISLCLLFILSVTLIGCGMNSADRKKVAVSMANSSDIWQRNGETIKNTLQAEGFIVDLQFADTADEQAKTVRQMIDNNPGCLVIGAVDSGALTEVLKDAKEKNIPVIAYDRLLMDTDAVSYYVSFDNEAIGEAIGEYIEAALDLKSGAGSYNIEFFAGDAADNNAHLYFDGTMKILKPYLANGQLICPSAQTSFEQVTVKDWNPVNAKTRMEHIYVEHYSEGAPLNVIIAPNDNVANGIISVLDGVYEGATPIITGQDADKIALDNIAAGKQTVTVYKNPADLAAKCVGMVKAVADGTTPEINDVTTYNNNVMVVPCYLCIPYLIDKDNLGMVR